MRLFVIDRKNRLFSYSQGIVRVGAGLNSLIKTAKGNELEPLRLLSEVLHRTPLSRMTGICFTCSHLKKTGNHPDLPSARFVILV
jgi:hypothetical protein